MQEIARTNQNPKDEWRGGAPPRRGWVLCPKQNLHCYINARDVVPQSGATSLVGELIQN
jgi:hypothetical protein